MDESSKPRGFSNLHHFTICGLNNVWLVNGYREKYTKYGKSTSYEDIGQLEKLISFCCYRSQRNV